MLPFYFPLILWSFLGMGSPIAAAALKESSEATLIDSSHEAIHWYYEGLKMREGNQFDKAVKAFTRFLFENPDHVYADRAQFMILDSHFRNQDYALALSDSILFENRFADSSKYPEVLLQRALIFLSLGRGKEAENTLGALIRLFPQSNEAEAAQEKLLSLKGKKP